MAELKTFLFTDIVRSVELKREMPGHSDAERDQAFIETILSPHRERIERRLDDHGGRVVSTAGDGHFLVFSDTVRAARWAIEIQQSHRDEPLRTPQGNLVLVRMSMHIGIPQLDPRDPNNFVGKPVDYAARLCDYATGGQILASRSVVAILEDAGMDGVSFYLHGRRDLKGIGQVEVYELVYDPAGPRKMRQQPRQWMSRQWTVLPPTIGLTEFHGGAPMGSVPTTSVAPAKLGNYELGERLGGGGMGDVYKARHTQFGRVRAVKVIKQHFVEAGHREVIRRFYQEIKAVGALEHPNIVVAIDSSQPTDSVHYLVMEYIDGIGADELVAQHGPLSVADACEIARQAARGLAYIHQNGMVHRDIKPSNLMVTLARGDDLGSSGASPDESSEDRALVKILDLGLALLVGDDQQRLTLLDDRAMGTAMYMSPEQWKTTSVDIRADIYSLGCTLYHLLAGKPPFWDSDLRPEKAHEREKLPPIGGPRPLERSLWDTIHKMTAKNPDDRFNDPSEVVAALAPWAEGNHLPELVRQMTGPHPSDVTQGVAKGDTHVAGAAESETLLGRTPSSWGLSTSMRHVSRRALRRTAGWIALLATLVVIAWLVAQATGRRESQREAQELRQRSLKLATDRAASEILNEINTRFDILAQLAQDKWLQERMVEIDDEPTNDALWQPVQEWLGARKSEFEPRAPADSWFINDRQGKQIARSPPSDKSLGEDYSHRDYFHGLGADRSKGTPGEKPIDQAHLSAVYRSTSSGRLKVAFSVPIENGRKGAARQVVGVLAMSVDLNEFNVLEKQLPAEYEVVLIDLRELTLEGNSGSGLVLHHQAHEPIRRGQSPPWISPELLTSIRQLLTPGDASATVRSQMLSDYRDPALSDGAAYWGALKAVAEQRRDGEWYDTHWLVLVQEPLDR
jgi:serine/threonine protein kinase/class 3 adenylate cyclase